VATTRKGRSIARNFGSKGSAVSGKFWRSDQPRCCGNPSWTAPAGGYGGWLKEPLFKLCASAAKHENSLIINKLQILRRRNSARIIAPSKGMGPKE
jgi:hypothetical protein